MGRFDSLRELGSLWYQKQKRRLQGTPETLVDSGGNGISYSFNEQAHSRSALREIKEMREDGGVVSTLVHTKALMTFGGGVELDTENEDLEAWVDEELPDLDQLVLEMGEDALWYPYTLAETVPTQGGGFSHIEPIEPWTMQPETDAVGEIQYWEQEINRHSERFGADEIGAIILNKSCARDKTGISDVLKAKSEIQHYREIEEMVQKSAEVAAVPHNHWIVGREGGAPLNDNDLRRVRTLVERLEGDTQIITGPDVEHDRISADDYDFESLIAHKLRQMAIALGVPLEMVASGDHGLGAGSESEARMRVFETESAALRRKFATQFESEFLRPILNEYSPYTVNASDLDFKLRNPIEQDNREAKMQYISEDMTVNERRKAFDMEPIEDEELGSSYDTARGETTEDAGGDAGGFFASDGDTDFRGLAVPDNAVSIDDPSEAPDDAQIVRGDRGGLYYVPAGSSGAADEGEGGDAEPFSSDAVAENDTVLVTGPDGQEVEATVDLVGDDKIFLINENGDMVTADMDGNIDGGGQIESITDSVDTTEILTDSGMPASPDAALDVLEESFSDMSEEDRQEALDNWREIIPESAFEGLEPDRAEAAAQAREQLDSNERFQEITELTPGLSDGIIFADAEEFNTTGFSPSADAERKAGVSFIHNNPLGTTNTDPEPPEPGQSVSSSDMASVLRHEYAHDVWDELDSDARKDFQQSLPDSDTIGDGLTDYATERPEEAFTELMAITTHPEYDAEKFPEWVQDLEAEYVDGLEGKLESDEPDTESETPISTDEVSDALDNVPEVGGEGWEDTSDVAPVPDKGSVIDTTAGKGVLVDIDNFEGDVPEWEVMTESGLEVVSGDDINATHEEQFELRQLQDVEDIATDDYPEAAVENAEMALEWKEETGNPNDCGTQVGWERANQLQNGESLSEDTINRMVSFFSRHDKGPQGQPKEDCSRMMWKAWGGDAGKRWAEDKQEEFENAREAAEGNEHRGVDLEAHPEWDQHYLQMHEGIFTSPERNLLEISGSQTPEFVKTRLRETILGGALFSEFDTIPSSELMNLREYMLETLTSDGWTVDGLADQLMQLDGVENRNKAELIARTESASVVNTAREEGYKERGEDDDRFYWEGSTQSEDGRTTDACDWLVNKTNPFEGGTPVSLERLKELIAEAPTHDPEMQNNIARPENYVVHPNERKTFVRHVG